MAQEKDIDWKVFEKLCAQRCTQEEIAAFLDVDRTTLQTRVKKQYNEPYSSVFERFSLVSNVSLRSWRLNHAKRNFKACEELCARYLGEMPILPCKDDNDVQITIKVIDARNNNTQAVSVPSIPECSVDGT
jgi:AraC-like DNA-binding protein